MALKKPTNVKDSIIAERKRIKSLIDQMQAKVDELTELCNERVTLLTPCLDLDDTRILVFDEGINNQAEIGFSEAVEALINRHLDTKEEHAAILSQWKSAFVAAINDIDEWTRQNKVAPVAGKRHSKTA